MWRYVLHFLIRTGELERSVPSNFGPNGATDRPSRQSVRTVYEHTLNNEARTNTEP